MFVYTAIAICGFGHKNNACAVSRSVDNGPMNRSNTNGASMKEQSAIATYAKMSAPVQQFVAALYAVRDDHISLQHTFDTQRPPNSNLTLWEAAAIADVVRGLPEGWAA